MHVRGRWRIGNGIVSNSHNLVVNFWRSAAEGLMLKETPSTIRILNNKIRINLCRTISVEIHPIRFGVWSKYSIEIM